MKWRRSRRSTPTSTPREIATTWQVASLLLEYPTEELVGRVPLLRSALAEVPVELAGGLTAYLDVLETTALGELQRDYVDTFDVTRKCALHLTYFTCGDTRKRGVALVQFKQAYRGAGVEFDAEELPDHLTVVLEFGAVHDFAAGWKLLNDHRVSVELLQRALIRSESQWAGVVGAVRSTLPVLDGTDEEALAVLIAAGPPTEEVGIDLDPYAIDPRLNPKPEPIDLTWGAPPPGGRPTSSSSLPSGSLPSFTPLVPRADRDRVLTEGVAR